MRCPSTFPPEEELLCSSSFVWRIHDKNAVLPFFDKVGKISNGVGKRLFAATFKISNRWLPVCNGNIAFGAESFGQFGNSSSAILPTNNA
jgi:hypothetical protein